MLDTEVHMTQQRGWRRFLQFRVSTLLAVTTGIAIGFAPLKLSGQVTVRG